MNNKISNAFRSITDTMHSIMTTLEQTISGGLLGLVTELKILVEKEENTTEQREGKGFIYYCISFLELYMSHIKKLQEKDVSQDQNQGQSEPNSEVVKQAYYYIMVMFGQLSGRTIIHLINKIVGSGQNLFEFGAITDIAEQILLLTPYGKVYSRFVEYKDKIKEAFNESNDQLGDELKKAIDFYKNLNKSSSNDGDKFINQYNTYLKNNSGLSYKNNIYPPPDISYPEFIENITTQKVGGMGAIQKAATRVIPNFQVLEPNEEAKLKNLLINGDTKINDIIEKIDEIEIIINIADAKEKATEGKEGVAETTEAKEVVGKGAEAVTAEKGAEAVTAEKRTEAVTTEKKTETGVDILHNKRVNGRQGTKSKYQSNIKISNNHEQLKKKYEALLKKWSHLISIHKLFEYLRDKGDKNKEDIEFYLKDSQHGGNDGETYLKGKITNLNEKIKEGLVKKIEEGDDSKFIEILDKKIKQIKKDLQTKINEQINKTKPIGVNADLISGLRKLITFIKFTDFEKYSNLKSEAENVMNAAKDDVTGRYDTLMNTRKEIDQEKQKEKFLSLYLDIINKKETNLDSFLEIIIGKLRILQGKVEDQVNNSIEKLIQEAKNKDIDDENKLKLQEAKKKKIDDGNKLKLLQEAITEEEFYKNTEKAITRWNNMDSLQIELKKIKKTGLFGTGLFGESKSEKLEEILMSSVEKLDPIDMISIGDELKKKFQRKFSFSSKSGGESKKTIKNIKDKVNKITRRLQTSYSNFNKGHNTRRVSFVKPKKNTRKKSY